MSRIEQGLSYFSVDFARDKKPSGRKDERRKGKLPNQIRHDENSAIAVGTWRKKREKNINKTPPLP